MLVAKESSSITPASFQILERRLVPALHPSDLARLDLLWHKHQEHLYRKPLLEHTRRVFDQIFERLQEAVRANRGLIVDACCGKGESTLQLALEFPDSLVLGIDHSAARIEYAPLLPDNALCLRAECVDMWRLLKQNGFRIHRLCLFYPNPYPKSEHLLRRWHAHPVFPDLLSNCDELELRTNMQYYAEEFLAVVQLAGCEAELQRLQVDNAITAFERKYAAAAETIWRVVAKTSTSLSSPSDLKKER